MEYKAHEYQKLAIEHVMDNPRSGLFLDMGLGKGSITLSAIVRLFDNFEISKVLVIGPKLVAEQTWPAEISKWDHTKHLTVSKIVGSPNQRLKALQKPADIYTVSRDNVAWLVEVLNRGGWDFDFLVIDELSSFKNAASQRFKALKKVCYLSDRCVGLTGTPAPNSLMDLWSQLYLLDQGQRLGKTITAYREAYFSKNYSGFGYAIKKQYESLIHSKINDICISMTALDHLDMPERMDIFKEINLSRFDQYLEFKRQEVLRLEEGKDITPVNAAALYSKLLQFANGAVYDADKNYHIVDNTKLDLLEEMVEELQGEPLLVFYSFQSDKERILARIKKAVAMPSKGGAEMIDKWNRKEIQVLIAHPASIGHGLNMQDGGRYMAWFGLPWSLELYQQAVKRLDRQGQKFSVMNNMLIAKGTVEEVVKQKLADKTVTQDDLMTALKSYMFD